MEKKNRILYLLATNKKSGAENLTCSIIEHFKNQYDVNYCSPQGEITNILKEQKIPYIPIKKLSYIELKKVIKKWEPDIIHANDYRASCLAALFYKRCKIISHIHGNNKEMHQRNIKTIIYKILSKRFCKIIWVSDSCFQNFFYKNEVKDKSIVLYNTLSREEIIKKANQYSIKDEYDLIFLGRLDYPKNPERLIEIAKLLYQENSNFRLAIVGDGSKKEIIEKLIKKNRLDTNIKIFGYQKNPYPILKKSKILIITSEWEGTPMAALEAQALNKPIVGVPIDGLKKMIINNCNGFLSNDNNEIVEKIIDFLKEDNYKRMSQYIEKQSLLSKDSIAYYEKLSNIYWEKDTK